MSQSLRKISRFFLIAALVVFSLRPSAVNCQNPVVLNSGNLVLTHIRTSVSSDVSGTPEHISRRCSFINVENQNIFKSVSTHKLIHHVFDSAGLFSQKAVLFCVVSPVFSSGLTPLRI